MNSLQPPPYNGDNYSTNGNSNVVVRKYKWNKICCFLIVGFILITIIFLGIILPIFLNIFYQNNYVHWFKQRIIYQKDASLLIEDAFFAKYGEVINKLELHNLRKVMTDYLANTYTNDTTFPQYIYNTNSEVVGFFNYKLVEK